MWFTVIGLVLMTCSLVLLRRVNSRAETLQREMLGQSDFDRRLKDLEVFKRQTEFSGEHAVVDVPENVKVRVRDYSQEESNA